MTIKDIRERINLLIYDSKPIVLKVLSILNFAVSLTAVGTLVYYYGFRLTEASQEVCFIILQSSFGFYILRFIIKLFYDFHPPTFIRKNWFETIIIFLLLVEGVAYNFFGTMIVEPVFISIGFKDFGTFSMIFVQLFVFVILLNSLFREQNYKPWMKIHPGWLFTISIALMTLLGTLLLMLPEMSRSHEGIGFIDSLFLSMSSVSVTGLTTVDVAHALSFKGQIIVLILIKEC